MPSCTFVLTCYSGCSKTEDVNHIHKKPDKGLFPPTPPPLHPTPWSPPPPNTQSTPHNNINEYTTQIL